MKASKKLLSLLLVVMLLVSAIPFQAFAMPVDGEGNIVVPVKLEYDGKSYDRSFTVAVNVDTVLSEEFAMNASGVVHDSSDKEFVGWFRDGKEVTDNTIRYSWLKDTAPEDYALTLKLNPKSNPDPEPNPNPDPDPEPKPEPTGHKVTVHVYVNGVKSDPAFEKTGVTSITLGGTLYEEIATAKSLDVADYDYVFYAGHAVTGTAVTGSSYTLDADAVYTIVITTKTPDPVKKNVHFFVDNVEYAVTECTEGQQPNVPEDPYKANYTFQGWYSAENGQGTRLVSGQNWNNSMPTTYYAYFTSNLNPKYDTIRVFVKRYVGNVLKGSEELAIADNQILRGESVLNWLNSKKDEIDGLVEDKYDGAYTWNPKYFYDNDSNAKLTSQDLVTNGNKSVFIKVNAPQIKVQLYIHVGKVTASPVIKDMDGYRVGDTVTKTAVDTVVKKYYSGSKMKIDGLYTADDWAELKKGNKPTASADLTVTENGMEIHVLVTNGSATGADPSNPKTGDYILDTAVALMVISGLAAAAVYVVGKKRRV